jgi:hypothetical protein
MVPAGPGETELVDDVRLFMADPKEHWVIGLALAMLIYCLVRFFVGRGGHGARTIGC